MSKTPLGRTVARCALAVGIVLSLVLASGAPSDGLLRTTTTSISK
jgi:hypothetical protein